MAVKRQWALGSLIPITLDEAEMNDPAFTFLGQPVLAFREDGALVSPNRFSAANFATGNVGKLIHAFLQS